MALHRGTCGSVAAGRSARGTRLGGRGGHSGLVHQVERRAEAHGPVRGRGGYWRRRRSSPASTHSHDDVHGRHGGAGGAGARQASWRYGEGFLRHPADPATRKGMALSPGDGIRHRICRQRQYLQCRADRRPGVDGEVHPGGAGRSLRGGAGAVRVAVERSGVRALRSGERGGLAAAQRRALAKRRETTGRRRDGLFRSHAEGLPEPRC